MTTRSFRRLGTTGAVTATVTALLLLMAPAAQAHVSVDADSTAAGSYAVLTFSVPHGCGDSPTTALSIQVPEGIGSVTPTVNPAWTVETTQEQLDESETDSHGNEVSERTAEVTYTAIEPLPDGLRDTVELSVALPEDAAGTTLYFPTVQTCTDGETGWVQIAADGQDPDELERPAPFVQVGDPAAAAAAAGEPASGEHSDAEDAAGTAADAAQTDESGGQGLALAALIIGSLGLLAGLAALLFRRRPSA